MFCKVKYLSEVRRLSLEETEITTSKLTAVSDMRYCEGKTINANSHLGGFASCPFLDWRRWPSQDRRFKGEFECRKLRSIITRRAGCNPEALPEFVECVIGRLDRHQNFWQLSTSKQFLGWLKARCTKRGQAPECHLDFPKSILRPVKEVGGKKREIEPCLNVVGLCLSKTSINFQKI